MLVENNLKKIFLVLFSTLILAGCTWDAPPVTPEGTASGNLISDKQKYNAEQAAKAYESINFTENGELHNLKSYITETMKPKLIGYIVLLTYGQPIARYTTKGPVTDCARELTPMQHPAAAHVSIANPFQNSGTNQYETMTYNADSPNDEGTYGGAEKCHFFYTESGQLIRWTSDFLWSDQPIRLRQEPLVYEVKEVK